LPPYGCTGGADNISKVWGVVGKMGDPMVWDTPAAELDNKGFVNQYGLSRKVNILTSSGMRSP
jgi:hypothetical protein